MLTPKVNELIASAYRFDGDREKAKAFFETGLKRAFNNLINSTVENYPISVFYAFKQSEIENQNDNKGALQET